MLLEDQMTQIQNLMAGKMKHTGKSKTPTTESGRNNLSNLKKSRKI